MVLNPDNCHFMTLRFQNQNFGLHYKNVVIKNSAEEKILGITIDNKLNYKAHTINLCIVANPKLSALCRISNYIDSGKCKLSIDAFVKSQFSYCPLMDVLYSRI